MNQNNIKVITPFSMGLIAIMAAGAVSVLYRLLFGLGASTNLNDTWPWGLWIAFDVVGGVALAAGGFIIAGAVYILNWKKYKPIVRAAIMNTFLGYLMAATSITLDIGHPFRIWHPIVMWQINSIMFIVAIHVVLYTTTLATESSPMFFEKLNMPRALKFVQKIMVGVVIFGVLLSCLHQSSLGALFLIAPVKLSALWSGSLLPYMFLVSAVLLGLNMVSFETIVSGKVFKHKHPMDILSGLARGSLIVAVFYFVMKIWQLVKGPGIGAAFDGSTAANMYLLEMLIGVILPMILLSMKDMRSRVSSIFTINILVIAGIVMNRFNVSIFGLADFAGRAGVDYFPSVMEIIVTLAIISFAIFAFKLSVKYLNMFPGLEH